MQIRIMQIVGLNLHDTNGAALIANFKEAEGCSFWNAVSHVSQHVPVIETTEQHVNGRPIRIRSQSAIWQCE